MHTFSRVQVRPSHRQRVIRSGRVATLLALAAGPVTLPARPECHRGTGRLQYVVVAVNDQLQAVEACQSLVLIRGDQVELRHAVVDHKQLPQPQWQLGGHSLAAKTQLNTAVLRWLKLGKTSLVVRGGLGELGSISFDVHQPQLRYMTLRVNGSPMVLRPDQLGVVQASDQLAVETIATNVGDPRQIQVALHRTPAAGNALRSVFQIAVSYREHTFARVDLGLAVN